MMFNFFADKNSKQADCYYIEGGDFNHIKNVLRMQEGETLLVSDDGKSHLCEITSLSGDCAVVKIIQADARKPPL